MFKRILEKISREAAIFLGMIVVGIMINFSIHKIAAWTEPTAAPLGGNLNAPINVGSNLQTKFGSLGINTGAVPLYLVENDQTLPAGVWRIPTDAGGLRIDRNLSALGNFSSYDTPFAISSTGNVGIGTISPGQKFDVVGNVNAQGYCINGANCISSWPSASTSYWTASGNNIYNNNTANVGVGMTNPAVKLDVNGATRTSSGGAYSFGQICGASGTQCLNFNNNNWVYLSNSSGTVYGSQGLAAENLFANSASYAGVFYDSNNTNYYLNPNATSTISTLQIYNDDADNKILFHDLNTAWYSMGIDQSDGSKFKINYGGNIGDATHFVMLTNGNVGIGTNTPAQKLEVNGNVSAAGFYYSSDANLKKDVSRVDNALDKILQLKGVRFRWRDNDVESYGFIAQEVERVFPELVNTDQQTGMKSVQYGNLTAPIVEAIKQQQNQIQQQNLLIKQLQSEIEALKQSMK